ncbi:MAG: protein tyrosine phosphatase family protein [Myxococcales bacterium]
MSSPIESFQVVNDQLATAAQPEAQDFAWLREQGFQAVINLSTPTARNFLHDEAKVAMESGLAYVHAPVDCSKLTPEHYEVVKGLLEAFAGKKVLLHCAGNVKSSGLAHVYRVRKLGEDSRRLRAELETQGWHEPKWYRYFDQLGA